MNDPMMAAADAIRAQFAKMEAEIATLRARVAELEAALRELMPVLEQDLDEAIVAHGNYSTRDFKASMARARAALGGGR